MIAQWHLHYGYKMLLSRCCRRGSAKAKFMQREWTDPGISIDAPSPQLSIWTTLFRLSPGFVLSTHPRYVVYLAESLLSSFFWSLKNHTFLAWLLALLLGSCEHLVRWLSHPVMKYIQKRERENGNSVRLCQCILVELIRPSEAAHKWARIFIPRASWKCLK